MSPWQTKYENLIDFSEKIKFKNLKIRKNKFQFNYDFSKFIDEEFKENEDFSEYIPKYGKEIGLPNLELNENGVCSLNFDGQVNVDIIYSKENKQSIFASPIGNIRPDADEKYFEHLLISNAFGTETGGSLIGIETEENRIVLSYCFISNTFSF